MTQRLISIKETKFSMYVLIFVKRHVRVLSNRHSNINCVLYENTIPGVGVEWKYEFWGENKSKFSSVVSDSLRPHGLQHARLLCLSPTPRAYSNSCPSSWTCHLTILSCVIPLSSCLQSFPASGSFPVSQFFPSGGQSIGASASASVIPINIQD